MAVFYDVLIIGAGPSGMMAAIRAAERGLSVVVLEKKPRPGIKLSITGKGRCNITNSADMKEFVGCFRNGKFLYSSFSAFSNEDLLAFFEDSGVACKLERGGRYFPASDKALDVVSALIQKVKKKSKIIMSFDVKKIKKENNATFTAVNENGETLCAANIIIACGGLSYPSTGSTGDGYFFAETFGHKIIKPLAALVPVILDSRYLKELKGLKLKNVEVSVIKNGGVLAKEFGEMEFTVFGADGPVILTLSGKINEELSSSSLLLSLNLKPALQKEQLDKRLLREIDRYGNNKLREMLKELLPKQLIKPFVDYSGLQAGKKCSQVNKSEREKILNALLDLRFKISGVKNIKEAIVTRGGVSTDEIDSRTMQSKIVEGLYFCGEVIDIDAPTGGFNLQAAFSTGYLAGNSIRGEK